MKIILTEGELIDYIKKVIKEYELPESPAMRVYNVLLEKGILNENSEVNLDVDTIQIFSLPYPAPEEYFTQFDGSILIVVPYLFEDEGGVEIQFEDDNDSEEVVEARLEVKDFITSNWALDFPIDFDDDYLYKDY
jgi:hypothetical protein